MQTFKLKEQMSVYGDTQTTLAKALDLTPRAMNFKINGRCQFKAGEIKLIKERYALSDSDVVKIFLN